VSLGGFAVDRDLSQQIAARPMTHATALHAILQASTALTDQFGDLASTDPQSVSTVDERHAAQSIQDMADLLSNEVTPAGDPLPDDVAADVERAVRDALGLKNTITKNADDAANSLLHALGLPAGAGPTVPNWPSWAPNLSTIIVGGALLLGAAYLFGRGRRAS
jgi:hypothetical protein